MKTETIELWEIGDIRPYEQNAKIHTDIQVEKLVKAIDTYGWTQPIVVDCDGVIIAGHGRRLAAIKMGMVKVPVIQKSNLTKMAADALRLADNRVSSTEYDMAAVQEELSRLFEADFDMSSIGFDEHELDFSTADLGAFDEDAFVDDIGDAVNQQNQENANSADEVDDVAAPVGDAIGFKRVTIAQSREIRQLMGQLQTKTNTTGVDTLLTALRGATA